MPANRVRYEAKVDRSAGPDACHPWRGAKNNGGYGQIRIDKRLYLAHRIGWELAFGPIPDGLCVCHRCDVRGCQNPQHWFLGTIAENNADRHAKGRTRVGRVHGSRHPNAKLTEAQVVEIRRLAAAGTSQGEIAARFGVEQTNVSSIVRRLTWRGVAT